MCDCLRFTFFFIYLTLIWKLKEYALISGLGLVFVLHLENCTCKIRRRRIYLGGVTWPGVINPLDEVGFNRRCFPRVDSFSVSITCSLFVFLVVWAEEHEVSLLHLIGLFLAVDHKLPYKPYKRFPLYLVVNDVLDKLKFWPDDGARWKVGITKVVAFHPVEDMNLCTKFHGSPSNSCWDISLKTNRPTLASTEPHR